MGAGIWCPVCVCCKKCSFLACCCCKSWDVYMDENNQNSKKYLIQKSSPGETSMQHQATPSNSDAGQLEIEVKILKGKLALAEATAQGHVKDMKEAKEQILIVKGQKEIIEKERDMLRDSHESERLIVTSSPRSGNSELREKNKKLSKKLHDQQEINSMLKLQAENFVIPQFDAPSFERAAFLRERPERVDTDPEVIPIIEVARKKQTEDNIIFHEVRDQDPEMPMHLENITTLFDELLQTIVSQRKKQPLVKQMVDMLQYNNDKAEASREINKILAGLSLLYEKSDHFGVLICRAFQLYHRDPLPTIANFLFANLYVGLREDIEDEEYTLDAVINYVYDHTDEQTGSIIIQYLRPSDMDDIAFLLFHLQCRCSQQGQEILDKIFDGRESISDVECLKGFKDAIDIWLDDEAVLDILEDDMTPEDASVLIQTPQEERISEYTTFNALAKSYNKKIRRDLSFLRQKILAANGGTEDVSQAVIEEIFSNERERTILFSHMETFTIESILNRVLRYLEGDILVKTDKRDYRASIRFN